MIKKIIIKKKRNSISIFYNNSCNILLKADVAWITGKLKRLKQYKQKNFSIFRELSVFDLTIIFFVKNRLSKHNTGKLNQMKDY